MKLRTADYDIGYPVYDAKFLNSTTLLVTGGGEGAQGAANINRLTALLINFDKRKVVKRFRELKLSDSIEAPTVMDAENNIILLGANEDALAIREGRNESLRQYRFDENQHLVYKKASTLEAIAVPLQYQKIIKLSHDGALAAIATSKLPTVIHILDAVSLNEKYEITTSNEVRDLDFSPDGKLLTYITQSTLEIISVVTGKSVMRKTDFKSTLSKVRFQDNDQVLIAANVKNQGGISVVGLSISKKLSVTKSTLVSKKCKDITSMDLNVKNAVIALAGSDNSVTLLKMHSLKTIKTFSNVHSLNITKVAFSPDGQFLASVSAAKSINVIEIPEALGVETHKIYNFFVRVFQLCIVVIICGASWLFYQYRESQQLPDISDYFTLVQKTQTTTEEPLTTIAVITTTSDSRPLETPIKPRVLERKITSSSEVAYITAEPEEYDDDVEEEYEDEEEEPLSTESYEKPSSQKSTVSSSTSLFTESIEELSTHAHVLEPETVEEIAPETTEITQSIVETSESIPETETESDDITTSSTSKEVTSTSKASAKPVILSPLSKTTSSVDPVKSLTSTVTETTVSEHLSVAHISSVPSVSPTETSLSTTANVSTSSVVAKKKKKSKKKKTKKSKKTKTIASEPSVSESESEDKMDLTALTTSTIEYESMVAPDLTQTSSSATTTESLSLESMTVPQTTSSPSFKVRTASKKTRSLKKATDSIVESTTSKASVKSSVDSKSISTTPSATTEVTSSGASMVVEHSDESVTFTVSSTTTVTHDSEPFEDRILEALDVEEDKKEDLLRGLEKIAIQAHAPEEIIEDMDKAIHKLEDEHHSSQPAESPEVEADLSFFGELEEDTADLLEQTTGEPDAAPEPVLEQIPNTKEMEESGSLVSEDVSSASVASKSSSTQSDSVIDTIVPETDINDTSDHDDSGDEADSETEEETQSSISTVDDFDETIESMKTAVAVSTSSLVEPVETETVDEESGDEEETSSDEESSDEDENSSEKSEPIPVSTEADVTMGSIPTTTAEILTTETLESTTTIEQDSTTFSEAALEEDTEEVKKEEEIEEEEEDDDDDDSSEDDSDEEDESGEEESTSDDESAAVTPTTELASETVASVTEESIDEEAESDEESTEPDDEEDSDEEAESEEESSDPDGDEEDSDEEEDSDQEDSGEEVSSGDEDESGEEADSREEESTEDDENVHDEL